MTVFPLILAHRLSPRDTAHGAVCLTDAAAGRQISDLGGLTAVSHALSHDYDDVSRHSGELYIVTTSFNRLAVAVFLAVAL